MSEGKGAVVGYARTSTADQEAGLEAQVADLKAAGCERVFSEHVSSLDAARPQLVNALGYLREGDVFVVTRPDRLARSVTDLLRVADDLKARGVALRILSMASLDTSTATGRLVLEVLASVAGFERAIMLERQRAGIAKAKAEGRYKGRAPTARARSAEVVALREQGVGPEEIVRRTGLGRASVYRILRGSSDVRSVTADASL